MVNVLEDLKIGDVCRVAPIKGNPLTREARYIGGGKALFVWAQSGELSIFDALPPTGGEERGLLPTDWEVANVDAAVRVRGEGA